MMKARKAVSCYSRELNFRYLLRASFSSLLCCILLLGHSSTAFSKEPDSGPPGSAAQADEGFTKSELKQNEMGKQSKPESKRLEPSYSSLKPGEIVDGFRTDAVYVNESDKEIGARFRHIKSGMFVDLVQIESVPQCFIWVNTVPKSDNGAPHTQEHLLLGKGNKGRTLGTRDELSLVSSSAMTMPWRTCYHFNTTAGAKVFFDTLGAWLDAFLNPDYTDTEIAREVCHLGVKEDPQSKKLSLEEKGTVYNEMQSSMHSPGWPLWLRRMEALYGKGHPLTFNSGGSPAGIRTLTADHIRKFHKEHYRLDNMGMICCFPSSEALGDVLSKLNSILSEVHSGDPVSADTLLKAETPKFPEAHPARADLIEFIDYPEETKDKPGEVDMSWLPHLSLEPAEHLLLVMFLGRFAGDASTPLYKRLVDGKTRTLNYGITGVSAGVGDDLGFPIIISAFDVSPKHANEADMITLRNLVKEELKKIAQLKPGSKELLEFNKRMLGRLKQSQDSNAEFVNSPPRFGVRNLRGSWMEHLSWLDNAGGFRRSLTLKPQLDFVRSKLQEKGNIWADYLKRWKLLDTDPQVMCLKPNGELLKKEEKERSERLSNHVAEIKKQFQESDEQKALMRFKAHYDNETEDLERLGKSIPTDMRFISDPPLTLDDHLKFESGKLPNGTPIVSSTFENMTISSASISMKVTQLPEEDLMYLSVLPQLLYRVGVIENGRALTHEQVLDRLREEVSTVYAYFRTNADTHRYELGVSGEGNSPAETAKAIKWMELFLQHPNWKIENLQRICDVVQHSLSSLRKSRDSGYEEHWAGEPVAGVRRQDDPLCMHLTHSFTRTHDVRRVVWRLTGRVGAKERAAFISFMKSLQIGVPASRKSAAAISRKDLSSVLRAIIEKSPKSLNATNKKIYAGFNKLTGRAKELAEDAANDLSQDLRDIPDSSLLGDWNQMCSEIIADVQITPAATLKKFEQLRKALVNASVARAVFVGSSASKKSVLPELTKLISVLPRTEHVQPKYSARERVFERYTSRERLKLLSKPAFLGFHNEKTTQGVISNSTDALKYSQIDKESLLKYLAAQLYAGAGAHSLFMQTWGAGLAYGSGFSSSPNSRLSYYADKTPSAPQTLKFVIDRLKVANAQSKTKMDPSLADYALAQAFYSAADGTFIARGDYIADALEDGRSPDVVKRFRKAILALRTLPDFERELFDRMIPQYARVIPGLTPESAQDKNGIYMIIGNDAVMKQYEAYLKSVKSKNTKLHVLYGRDYWI